MITEDYCSYEVAKLLKDKGFNEDIHTVYEPTFNNFFNYPLKPNSYSNVIAAPTHQMAMKWLREIHNKHCDIGYDIDLDWFFQVIDLKETVENDYLETKHYHTEDETGFNTYEEAVEAALKYVLENLI